MGFLIKFFYSDIGAKIKVLAIITFIIEAIGSIITGLVLTFGMDDVLFLLTCITGPIVAWVSSWILYAFGEIAEDIHAIRNVQSPIPNENTIPNENKHNKESSNAKSKKPLQKLKAQIKESGILLTDDDFIDIKCPECGEMLSFLKDQENAVCPNCETIIELK